MEPSFSQGFISHETDNAVYAPLRGLSTVHARAAPSVFLVIAVAVPAMCAVGRRVELPAPETVTLETKDGVALTCRWYASPTSKDGGKNVVPVIILHGSGGQSSQYDGLASDLQKVGRRDRPGLARSRRQHDA